MLPRWRRWTREVGWLVGEAVATLDEAQDVPAHDVQPWLGDETLWPVRPDLVELVKTKSFLHTGKIVGKNPSLCRAVCIELLMGQLSLRQIANLFGISRNSIEGIEQVMRDRGELEPLAKVLKGQVDRACVLGLWRWNEGLLNGTVHPGQTPIPTAAMLDKRAMLGGGAPPEVPPTEDLQRLTVLVQIAMRQDACGRLSDLVSGGDVRFHGAIDVSSSVATAQATEMRPAGQPPAAVPDGPPADQVQAATHTAEGGGGGLPAPASQNDRWAGPEKF